jgi:ribosomal protein S13
MYYWKGQRPSILTHICSKTLTFIQGVGLRFLRVICRNNDFSKATHIKN